MNSRGDVLHLAHAQACGHHLHAGAHDSAHAAAIGGRFLHQSFGARQLGQKRLDFVRRAFLSEESQDDADSRFGSCPLDAEIGDETPD